MKRLYFLLLVPLLLIGGGWRGDGWRSAPQGSDLSDDTTLKLGSSTDSVMYFIWGARDSMYYDTMAGTWTTTAGVSVLGVMDAYYGFFDSLKASTHAYFGYTVDSSFYLIYGLRDTVVDYDTIGGAKLTVTTAKITDDLWVVDSTLLGDALVCSTDVKIIDDLYVVDSAFFGVVIDSGNHVILGETFLGNAATDTVTLNGVLATPEAVRFVTNSQLIWSGGGAVNSSTYGYYVTTGVDDELVTYAFSIPYLVAGGTVVVDTMTINYRTEGAEDSVKFVLQSIKDAAKTRIDSTAWLTGTTTFQQSPTLLTNGDLTVVNNTAYAIYAECDNDDADDVIVESFIRIVYHLE